MGMLVVSWYSWRPVVQHVKRKHVRCTKILSSVGATVETLPACSRRKSALGRRNSKHTSPSSSPVHRHPVRMASFCVDEPRSNCETVNSLFFRLLVFVYLVKQAWRLINVIQRELWGKFSSLTLPFHELMVRLSRDESNTFGKEKVRGFDNFRDSIGDFRFRISYFIFSTVYQQFFQ